MCLSVYDGDRIVSVAEVVGTHILALSQSELLQPELFKKRKEGLVIITDVAQNCEPFNYARAPCVVLDSDPVGPQYIYFFLMSCLGPWLANGRIVFRTLR